MTGQATRNGRGCGHGGKGFTIVEMMVVVFVIAILAAIAYPSYVEHMRRSRRVEAVAALTELMQHQERHYSRRNRYYSFSRDSNPSGHKWYSGSTPDTSSHEISARPCEDKGLDSCVRLLAVPGTAAVNRGYDDPACGSLTLGSDGMRTPENPACWR